MVNNVAPTATLANNGPVNEGSPATVSFSNQFDPSSTDTTAGFHYAFGCTNGVLPTTYAAAGSSSSTTCTFADNGSYTVSGRIFDKDNGYNELHDDRRGEQRRPDGDLHRLLADQRGVELHAVVHGGIGPELDRHDRRASATRSPATA